MKRLALLALCLAVFVTARPAISQTGAKRQADKVTIRITLPGSVLTATLEDSATARDFAALLPLKVPLKDYASTEKVADLPKKLSLDGAPAGIDPSVGDIAYYAPWGNLAIFYKDFGYSRGLVKIGRIDGNVRALRQPGPMEATIELIEK